MDIKIENNISVVEKKKGCFWKKFLIILSVLFFVSFFFIVYARYKATSGIRVIEYKVTNSELPSNFHGFKIVQFSDVYFGNTVDLKYLDKIVDSINNLKPDIVVFTGDLVSNIDDDKKNNLISILNKINVSKFAISGDNDNDLFDDIIVNSGFVNLNNSSFTYYYNGNTPILITNKDEESSLFDVFLLHKPDDVLNFNYGHDLILAGHSLNGQINLPFIKKLFLKDGSKKYYNGHYVVNDNDLYVSSGIGTTNFKFRLNNRPSINLYRLTTY